MKLLGVDAIWMPKRNYLRGLKKVCVDAGIEQAWVLALFPAPIRFLADQNDHGVSVGLAGTVVSNMLVGAGSTSRLTIDEDTYSTNADNAFRWDSTGKQWIFDQATGKNNPSLSQTITVYRF